MDENKNGKDRKLEIATAPPFNPEDVVLEIRAILTKNGDVYMFFPQDRLAACLALFSKGLDLLTGLVGKALGEQEQRRVIPVTQAQVPPGLKLV
jgi:hypothetical protein